MLAMRNSKRGWILNSIHLIKHSLIPDQAGLQQGQAQQVQKSRFWPFSGDVVAKCQIRRFGGRHVPCNLGKCSC